MGLSSSKTKTENAPWSPAQPYILNNLAQTQDTYNQNQPMLQQFAKDQQATYGRVAPGAERGIMGAQGLVNDNIAGKNLNGNPFLEGMIGKTRANVTAGVNDQFGPAGRFGSGMHAKILADQLAEAENGMRFQNYGMERGYQQDGIGQASGLMGGAQGLLNNAAELPWIGTNAANGGIRQASNGYGTQTTTQSQGLGSMLGGLAGAGLSGWASGGFKKSDRRAKTNIVRVGELSDGLPVYDFDYIDGGERQRGVMADEVAVLRPWALGPEMGGFASVNYDAL